ncbi:flavin-containing monooxygenase [Specibacter sp. RAF43]|uniref:flavin-containing monooxygenase n=1 Tax=Specibacter sp. RAF43 TaxID=3233057 RepID=UPI003F9A22DF
MNDWKRLVSGENADGASRETYLRRLSEALAHANLPTLLAVLVQLTGDMSLLEGEFRPTPARGTGDHNSGGLSDAAQERLRTLVMGVLTAHHDGELPAAASLTPAEVKTILGAVVGETVPDEEAELLADELFAASRVNAVPVPQLSPTDAKPRVLIIGGGFSGLCAAVRLAQQGISYTIVEKNSDIGGTWFENVYPGAGVDTPIHLYSFSFDQRADWPHHFAGRDEVQEYLISVAKRYRLRENTRFDTTVTSARWDDDGQQWVGELLTADGQVESFAVPIVISAVGLLNIPAFPKIDGLATFNGPAFHTAAWDRTTDVAGKRVALVGSGASAMQVLPAIVDRAAQVTVFQRTPGWIIPNPNVGQEVDPVQKFLMANVPWYLSWYRLRLIWNFGDRLHAGLQIDPEWHLSSQSINAANERHRTFLSGYIHSQLADRPDLAEKCLPSYPPYGKRPLLDHGWYASMKRPNVELVDEGVASINGNTVITTSGRSIETDVLVLATGFQTLNVLGTLEVRGRSGATLREAWGEDDARAYLGMTVPDFPNFFILFGPNTSAGHGGSHVLSAEMQVRYILQVIEQMDAEGLTSVECRDDVYDDYNEKVDAALSRTVWTHPAMSTYYRNAKGRIVTNMPWTNGRYWHLTRTPNLNDFSVRVPLATTSLGAGPSPASRAAQIS